MSRSTSVIAWRYWYWTSGSENLFLLSKEELQWFKDIVDGYYACTPSWEH